MASERFDYDSPAVPDTTVADVAAAIRSNGKLPPLSDEERELRRLQNELYRIEKQEREEERRIERDRRQQEDEGIARAEAAAELAAANRKVRLEQQRRDQETRRDQQLVNLQIRAKQQEVWASNVETAARVGIMQRQRQSILSDLHNHFHPTLPPEPEPEPEPESPPEPRIGDPDFFEKWQARSSLRSWPLRTWR
jgi:hypothetical protein